MIKKVRMLNVMFGTGYKKELQQETTAEEVKRLVINMT